MSHSPPFDLSGRRAVLATMHGKETVIGPALAGLGLRLEVVEGLDTDRFGTFTGEVPRAGSQLDAARAKIAAAFAARPDITLGIASEGALGPDPSLPLVGLDRELVLLVDREAGLELVGHYATWDTNFGHQEVRDAAAGYRFALARGFPTHGMIVRPPSAPLGGELIKDLATWAALEAVLIDVIDRHGAARLETDMRASRNPTRLRAIGKAADDLARRLASRCPSCDLPGYDVVERTPGLPCAWCGTPTDLPVALVLACQYCAYREVRPAPGPATADPSRCPACNP